MISIHYVLSSEPFQTLLVLSSLPLMIIGMENDNTGGMILHRLSTTRIPDFDGFVVGIGNDSLSALG
jgi:hypothetical protein